MNIIKKLIIWFLDVHIKIMKKKISKINKRLEEEGIDGDFLRGVEEDFWKNIRKKDEPDFDELNKRFGLK